MHDESLEIGFYQNHGFWWQKTKKPNWYCKLLDIIQRYNNFIVGKCCYCYREDCNCDKRPKKSPTYGEGDGNCKCHKGEDCDCDDVWYDVTDPLACTCHLCSGCDNSTCTCDSGYDVILSRVESFKYSIKRIIYDVSNFKTRLKKSITYDMMRMKNW